MTHRRTAETGRVCKIKDCGRRWYCRGLCVRHYCASQKARRSGMEAVEDTSNLEVSPPWEFTNPQGEAELAERFGDD